MQPKTPAYLWEIQEAARIVINATHGLSPSDIAADIMLRSAVERQLEIAGEAARRLSDHDDEIASQLTGLRAAISIRNVIAHQYDRINWTRVREMIDGPLTELERSIAKLLDDVGPPGATD